MLRISEAAALLGIAPSTLRAFADRGLIPCMVMPTGERRFAREAVETFRVAGPPVPAPPPAHSPAPASPAPPPTSREVAPWERRVLDAKAQLEVEKVRREIAQLAADDDARAAAAEREAWASTLARVDQIKALEADRQRQQEAERNKQHAALAAVTRTIAADLVTRQAEAAQRTEEAGHRARQRAAALAREPEDRRLRLMEEQYQQRKALLDLANPTRHFRR